MNSESWIAVALSALTLLGVIVNAYINWKRDERNRRWQIEDEERKRLLSESIKINTALTLDTQDKTKQVLEKVNNRHPDARTRSTDAGS